MKLGDYKILIGFPGPSLTFEASLSLFRATLKHDAHIIGSQGSWDNFNTLWATALNLANEGKITHFAMLHSDIDAGQGWADTLVSELVAWGADLVSVPMAIKDGRGALSCGVGDVNNPWNPLRRLTIRELDGLPDTFTAADFGYDGFPLLHNNGCWLADVRREVFHQTDENGVLKAYFDFPRQVYKDPEDGLFRVRGESEDWWFSRKLHELGAKTIITKKVQAIHQGGGAFPNYGGWGTYENGDEATAAKWRSDESTVRLDAKCRTALQPAGV